MNQKQKVYRIAAIFLQYPEREWNDWLAEFQISKEFEDPTVEKLFSRFVNYCQKQQFDELCRQYVETFDFNEKTSLYLTHTVFKDSRDRGSILVQLRQQMMELGMEFTTEELPDYLPLILEFASLVDEKDSEEILKLHLQSIRNLALELEGIDSPYRFLVQAAIHAYSIPTINQTISEGMERRNTWIS